MRAVFVLSTVALIGCTYPDSPSRVKWQDVAEQVVWREVYGMHHTKPPEVTWVFNTEVDELGHSGWTPSALQSWIACRFPGTGEGDRCSESILQTAYAHEMNHARCAALTGDPDASHSHCDWKIVDEARNRMGEAVLNAAAPCLEAAKTDAEVDACLF